ncbi:MAG: hypothetical protein U9O18_01635 [Chloroflexota bacterium]|nr:hypothetical protein [Chloroflexota bacterium]
MIKLDLLSAMALTAALLLPSGTALAQDGSTTPDPATGAAMTAEDPRFAELEALVPPALAGLPLGDNLVFATGEELLDIMQPEESAILEEVLEANGKTPADYAAATSWLPTSESDIVVIQAHRIAGVDASETMEAWVEIVSVNLDDPQSAEGFIAGRPVTLVSDASSPEVPTLHLFPAGDVMWMIIAADEAIVEEAMGAVGAEGDEEAEAEPEA